MNTDAWISALADLYAGLDREIALRGWACRGCGECCHFDVQEHILYASGMERQYLSAMSERPPEPDGDADRVERGLRCPYQKDNRCLARDGRPLGCRLHFCEASDSAEDDFFEKWHSRLKALHEETGYSWDYRPLLPLDE